MLNLISKAQAAFEINDPLNDRFTNFSSIIDIAIGLVFWVGVGLSTAFIAISGIKIMSSKGDPKALQTAQQSLTWSIVGFIVVIGAGGIVTMIAKLLGAENFSLVPDF